MIYFIGCYLILNKEQNMKMFIKRILLITSIFSLSCFSNLFAGGSFILDDIKPLLDQAPQVKAYLFSTLDFDACGSADRIGNNVNPRLGGARVGPYCINARPKGSKSGNIFEICINTDIDFRDKKGKSCELDKAYSFKEKFLSVEIKPLK